MQSSNTKSPGQKVVNAIDDSASAPSIQWGGSEVTSSGTGIYGDMTHVRTSVSGTKIVDVSSTGVAITGTLSASGATTMSGALNVVGDFSVATNKFNVTASSGNTAIAGTANVVGDLSVATNKFNVTAASGNTAIAGSLAVGGGTALAKILKGVVSVTISALAAGALEDIEVTISGVAAGNSISVTPLLAAMEAGVSIVGAFYSDTNKIKIRVANLSGSSLTGSTSNFTYLIVQ